MCRPNCFGLLKFSSASGHCMCEKSLGCKGSRPAGPPRTRIDMRHVPDKLPVRSGTCPCTCQLSPPEGRRVGMPVDVFARAAVPGSCLLSSFRPEKSNRGCCRLATCALSASHTVCRKRPLAEMQIAAGGPPRCGMTQAGVGSPGQGSGMLQEFCQQLGLGRLTGTEILPAGETPQVSLTRQQLLQTMLLFILLLTV